MTWKIRLIAYLPAIATTISALGTVLAFYNGYIPPVAT